MLDRKLHCLLLEKMALLHLVLSRTSKGVPCQTLGNPSGIFLIRHCFGTLAIHSTMQIQRTDIVDKQKILWCAGTLPCDTSSKIRGFRSLTRHSRSVLGSPAGHVLQIARFNAQ